MADINSSSDPVGRWASGDILYRLRCPDCGVERSAPKYRAHKPCHPCAQKRRATHGLSNDPLYRLLWGMRMRCELPGLQNEPYYHGKGIKVCDEWRKDPAAFVKWALENGYRKGLEIDRIDNDGDYEPGNCQFITHARNSRKRSNARCDEARARLVKDLLSQGIPVKRAASIAGVPYMSAWHISKGNTWRDV